MTEEARLVPHENGGLVPEGEGWFVVNARAASWVDGDLGKYVGFEGKAAPFLQLGLNINILAPGEPMTMYHREDAQEDFLVVAGACVLIVGGAERPLRAWDFFHCPPGLDHAIVGAGDGPSVVIAVGARTEPKDQGLFYPAEPAAQKHGAAVEHDTADGDDAYAKYSFSRTAYHDGWCR